MLACAVQHPGRTNGIPFIVDFLPHLEVMDTAPDSTITQFKERWAHTSSFPNLLGDAAFGTEASIKELKNENIESLFSMPSDSHPYLWETLSAGLTPSTWRAAINDEGIVASVHLHRDPSSNKTSMQQVMSTIHTGSVSLFYFKILILF